MACMNWVYVGGCSCWLRQFYEGLLHAPEKPLGSPGLPGHPGNAP